MRTMASRRGFLGLVSSALLASACSRGGETVEGARPKIGIALWYTADNTGARVVELCASVAEALGCDYQVFEHHYEPEKMVDAARVFADCGCTAMICCCSLHSDLEAVIDVCNERGLYLVQFFGSITKGTAPQAYEKACASRFFVGSVAQNEVGNGKTLAETLLDGGSRRLGLVAEIEGDRVYRQRLKGVKAVVDSWNEAHPHDACTLFDPVFAPPKPQEAPEGAAEDEEEAVETDRARAQRFADAVATLVSKNPGMDGLVVAADGAEANVGAIGQLANLGRTGELKLVSTGFIDDLREQLEVGAVFAQAGGSWMNALFAFLLAYRACTGKLKVSKKKFGVRLSVPYLFIGSVEDYDDFASCFVDEEPYDADELRSFVTGDANTLSDACKHLSIADAKARKN